MTDLTMDYLRYKQMIASGEIKVKEEIKRKMRDNWMDKLKLRSVLDQVIDLLDENINHVKIIEVMEIYKIRIAIQEFLEFIEGENNEQ